MRSRVAEEVERKRRERLAAMTPEALVGLALRMSESGLIAYMATHGLDRATAIARIKATRRPGRRPSRAADAE